MATPTSSPVPPWPLRKRIKIAVLAWLITWLVRVLGVMVRLEAPPVARLGPLGLAGRPIIVAAWHGDSFPIMCAYRGEEAYVVTSRSADGEMLTRVLHRLGQRTVRGSSSRGGARALIDLARVMRNRPVRTVIAVDGPRGPRRVVKPGIILLAKLTGAAIIPMACSAPRRWQFASWDRYWVPKPLSRVVIRASTPIEVPPDAHGDVIEAKRQELERQLTAFQDEIDREMGVGPERVA